jgi:hypothetical protein
MNNHTMLPYPLQIYNRFSAKIMLQSKFNPDIFASMFIKEMHGRDCRHEYSGAPIIKIMFYCQWDSTYWVPHCIQYNQGVTLLAIISSDLKVCQM